MTVSVHAVYSGQDIIQVVAARGQIVWDAQVYAYGIYGHREFSEVTQRLSVEKAREVIAALEAAVKDAEAAPDAEKPNATWGRKTGRHVAREMLRQQNVSRPNRRTA